MTPTTAAVTGRTQTGAMGSAKWFLLSLQAASGAQTELKVVTVKPLRALAPGNPEVCLLPYPLGQAGMGLLGMLVEVEQVWVCSWGCSSDDHQLCCSFPETQQEDSRALDIGHHLPWLF